MKQKRQLVMIEFICFVITLLAIFSCGVAMGQEMKK
jgi:hypothetical protein